MLQSEDDMLSIQFDGSSLKMNLPNALGLAANESRFPGQGVLGPKHENTSG